MSEIFKTKIPPDAVTLGERVGRLSNQEFLDDLSLEFDGMRAVLSHGLSPRKPGSVSRFSGPYLSIPKGALQTLANACDR